MAGQDARRSAPVRARGLRGLGWRGHLGHGEGIRRARLPQVSFVDRLQALLEALEELHKSPGTVVASAGPAGALAGPSIEVVLEAEVGGACYVLVRRSTAGLHRAVRLSPRERQIVAQIAAGHPNKRIAAILGIRPSTVATHIRRLYTKLGVSSRGEAVARLLEQEVFELLTGGESETPALRSALAV